MLWLTSFNRASTTQYTLLLNPAKKKLLPYSPRWVSHTSIKAFARWPVRARISFSSTPALKRDEVHVTRRQYAVLRFTPAALHKSGNISYQKLVTDKLLILFRVFIPTGTFFKNLLY